MQDISQIKVGKHITGVVGLKEAMEEIANQDLTLPNQEIAAVLIEKLSQKNYIAPTRHKDYKAAFIREYKKFIGEPVPEPADDSLVIKVLGAGCPTCDKLEQLLMQLIAETGVDVDLEHVRDLKEISTYGVMGSPALIINRRVKAVGKVPSRAKLKKLILQAQAELKK